MTERDLTLRLRAENSDLKAKLAESTAELDKLKASAKGAAAGTEELAEGVAATAGPLGVMLAVAAAAGIAIRELEDRGIELNTAGEASTKIWDSVAVVLGGTSKAALEAERGAAALQARFQELDVTQRSFKTGADLAAAAGIDLSRSMEGIGVAALTSGLNAREFLDNLNAGFNELHVTAPGVAAELSQKFIELGQAAQNGNREAVLALRDLNDHVQKLGDRSRAVIDEVKKNYGEDAPKAFGEFTTAAARAVPAFEALTEGGVTSAQAYGMLKKEFAATAEGAAKFAGVIPQLDAELQANIAVSQKLVAQYGSVEAAIDKIRTKTLDSVNAFNEIGAAIDYGTQRYGDHKVAIRALEKPIEALIAKIERQRDSEGQLSVSNQAMLDALMGWLRTTGDLNPQMDKLTDSIDKQIPKLLLLAGATEQINTQTFSFRTGLEISNSAMEAQKAQLDLLVEALKSLGLEYDRVKEKGEAAFGGEGAVPGFGHADTVGAYSSLNASGSNLAPGGGGASTGPTPPPFTYPGGR